MSQYIRTSLTALLMATVFGCGEYGHTNLYEPNAAVAIVIDGPSTITTRFGSVVIFTYHSDPVLPDVMPVWSSQTPLVLESVLPSAGYFRPFANGTVTISVALGPHVQTKRVVVAVP